MNNNISVLYHANCFDGFTAAYVAWKHFTGVAAKFIPVNYYEPIPLDQISDTHVFILDFSYDSKTISETKNHVKSLCILDHHKTAAAELSQFHKTADTIFDWFNLICSVPIESDITPLNVIFDMNRSGAGLAYDFFMFKTFGSRFVHYVEDRDLWNFNLYCSKEVNEFIGLHEFDFDTWDHLNFYLEDDENLEAAIKTGRIVRKKFMIDLLSIISKNIVYINIDEHKDVPCVNVPHMMASEAGNLLSKDKPFAACYTDTPTGRRYSLRSQKDGGIDVSEIAKRFGGGGHKNAAGFTVHGGMTNLASNEFIRTRFETNFSNTAMF